MRLKFIKKPEGCVEIKDNGLGIPEEEIEKIFLPFYRDQRVKAENISGSGLGITIAKKIVEAHNGKITVESKVDIGTTITIKLSFVESL